MTIYVQLFQSDHSQEVLTFDNQRNAERYLSREISPSDFMRVRIFNGTEMEMMSDTLTAGIKLRNKNPARPSYSLE